ncbi:hypothetical protein M3P21_03260 [Ruegeria sp. 2012CJ41-6]|uniref:Uncharacterized protein n=1 Tax=Ruegeria spongiae TaxID=2942209 RepID=A0ABT0Q031_9RHOB|nr:hypothetical protein [Ruegeria spongiae]MCL6282538.1 hypothetical protein [Ruegeria spongiae]
MNARALDQQLLQAHAAEDKTALVRLYTQAADHSEAGGDLDAACFYLTHAFVFALEIGVPEARALNARLVDKGRAHPWQP